MPRRTKKKTRKMKMTTRWRTAATTTTTTTTSRRKAKSRPSRSSRKAARRAPQRYDIRQLDPSSTAHADVTSLQTNAKRGTAKTTPAKRSAEGTRRNPSRGSTKKEAIADEDEDEDDEDFNEEDAAAAEEEEEGDDDDAEVEEEGDDDEKSAKQKQREGGRVRLPPFPCTLPSLGDLTILAPAEGWQGLEQGTACEEGEEELGSHLRSGYKRTRSRVPYTARIEERLYKEDKPTLCPQILNTESPRRVTNWQGRRGKEGVTGPGDVSPRQVSR